MILLGYVFIIIKNSGYLFSNEDIEEIASDVFLAVWKNKEKLDLNKEIAPYIGKITKNLISKKNRNNKYNDENIEDFQDLLYEQKDNIRIEENEKLDILINQLMQMKEEDKKIFTYYYYESKSIKEISVILKISQIKAKSRLSRIRKKMKKELEKRGYSYERG